MKARRAVGVVVVLCFCTVSEAWAQGGSGLGQTFLTPGVNPFLQSIYTGTLLGNDPTFSYTFYLQQINSANGFIGAPVFQQMVAAPVAAGQTVSINLMLVPNAFYAFFLAGGPTGVVVAGDHIAGGTEAHCFLIGSSGTCAPLGGGQDIEGFALNYGTPPNVSVTPEPMTIMLLGTGLIGVAMARRRRRETES